MAGGEWETGWVLEVSGLECKLRMASLAIANPAVGDVIRVDRTGKVAGMTDFARRIEAFEVAHLRPFVADKALGAGVWSHERETCGGVESDRTDWLPGLLVVALFAGRAETPSMDVLMAPSAAPACEHLDWPSIVVATQAGRFGVSAIKWHTRLGEMIEHKLAADLRP